MKLMFQIGTILAIYTVCALAQIPPTNIEETRYCTTAPVRNADGTIARNQIIVRNFRKVHPCPVTGLITGACAGWSVDHVIPLACGGCDAVDNMQWLPNTIKSCAGTQCKDRWELKIYCQPFQKV